MKKHVCDYFSIPAGTGCDFLDLRDLEAPGPMEKILLTSAQLPAGGQFLAHLPHVPGPLFPHLEARGLAWKVLEEPDGSAIVLIRKAP